jgi:hypothetical protein
MLALLLALSANATAAPATPADDDPIICTRDYVGSEVGTHMHAKKTCMKKSERDLVEKNTQRELRYLHDLHQDPGHKDAPR